MFKFVTSLNLYVLTMSLVSSQIYVYLYAFSVAYLSYLTLISRSTLKFLRESGNDLLPLNFKCPALKEE